MRHTIVAVPDSICFGQTDVPLRDAWEQDFTVVNADDDYHAVYSSPLSRCTKLAAHFTKDFIVEPRLAEMNFGDWEMRAWDDIPAEQIQPWYNDFINRFPPNGENLLILKERITHFWEAMQEKHQKDKILIITHSGVIRIILQLVMEFPLENMFRIQPQHGKKMLLSKNEGIWKWTGMNV